MLRPDRPSAPRRRAGPRATRPGEGLLVFAVALLLRAGYTWVSAGPGATPSSDPAEYDLVAWNLARGLGFAFGHDAGAYPTAFVPPVVPWITSLLYRVAGHHFFAALLLQCVIGALVPLLVRALASATFGGDVARIAGWLAALHPLLIFFSGYLLTETTFTAALLVALIASVGWLKTPRPGRALGTGMLWGLAALTRPTALPLPLLVALWAWGPLGLTVSGRDRIRQIALLGLGVALVVGPWTIRNAIVMHAFVPVTTGAGRALLDSNNPIVWNDPARRGGAIGTFHVEPYASMLRGKSEPEVDRIARREAFAFLGAHVREWPAMAWAKLARFWRVTREAGGTGHWQRRDSPLLGGLARVDPFLVWSVLVMPFAALGLIRALTGPRRWFLSLPALMIAAFTLGALLFWGALRMRVPIEPLVALYAAVGFEDARRRILPRARGLTLVRGRTG